jgi:hypothetical protein
MPYHARGKQVQDRITHAKHAHVLVLGVQERTRALRNGGLDLGSLGHHLLLAALLLLLR